MTSKASFDLKLPYNTSNDLKQPQKTFKKTLSQTNRRNNLTEVLFCTFESKGFKDKKNLEKFKTNNLFYLYDSKIVLA